MIILSPQLGVSPTATTGGETYDREVLLGLGKLGHSVYVLLPKDKQVPKNAVNWHIDYAPFSHFVPPYTFNFFSLPWVLSQLDRVPHRFMNGVVVRIHSPEYLFFTAYLLKKIRPHVPVFAHYHLDQTSPLWTTFNKVLLNCVDGVVVDSAYLKSQLVNRVGIQTNRISVVYCGADTKAIYPMRNHVDQKTKTILYLGRFIQRKRPDFAIEAFSILNRKNPRTRLVMIGEGPMESELRKQCEALGISQAVEFPGPLFGKEKLEQYHNADVFLFPSEKEGFVLVVLEAMAAGLPLVVPNSHGFPEAVTDGVNGFLVDSNDPRAWTRSIERVIADTDLANSMRLASRRKAVKMFSWESCVRRLSRVYQEMAIENGPKR